MYEYFTINTSENMAKLKVFVTDGQQRDTQKNDYLCPPASTKAQGTISQTFFYKFC